MTQRDEILFKWLGEGKRKGGRVRLPDVKPKNPRGGGTNKCKYIIQPSLRFSTWIQRTNGAGNMYIHAFQEKESEISKTVNTLEPQEDILPVSSLHIACTL